MKYINLHTHGLSGDHESLEILNVYPSDPVSHNGVYSSGIHPWYVRRETLTRELQLIEDRLQDPNCIAVGECGLDHKVNVEYKLQQKAFEQQLMLAQEFQKPVILHIVGAYSELAALHKNMKLTVPLIIHGFAKNVTTAKQMLDHNIYLSFGKHLMRNPAMEEVLQSVPDDRFFLETDSADQSIEEVYNKAASYRGISVEDLQELMKTNYKRIFTTNTNGRMD